METKDRIDKMLKKSEVILQAGKPKHNDIKVPPFTDGFKRGGRMNKRIRMIYRAYALCHKSHWYYRTAKMWVKYD